MSGLYRKGVSYLHGLRKRLRNLVIRDVPEDYQSCEFDCREVHCSVGNWEECEKRLHFRTQTQK